MRKILKRKIITCCKSNNDKILNIDFEVANYNQT